MPLRLEVLALHPAGPPRKQGPLRRPWSPQSSGSPPRRPTGGRAGTHSPKIHSFSTPGVPENSGNWPTQSEPPPSPPSQCPRRRGGGTFSTGARETTRGQPRRHTSGTPTPRVAARAPWPAPARQRNPTPPASAPSPQSRGSGAQVLPGPVEAHGARSGAREPTAGGGEGQPSTRRRQKRRPYRPGSPQGGCPDLSPRLLLLRDAVSTAVGWTALRPETDLGAQAQSLQLSQEFVPLAGKRAPTVSSPAAQQLHGHDCPGMRAFVLGRGRVTLGPAAFLWVDTDAGKRKAVTRTRTWAPVRSGRRLIAG